MQSVEINTSQNVTIEYELASLRDRMLAFLIDIVILAVGLLIIGALCSTALGTDAMKYIWFLVLLPIFLFYSLFMEAVYGGQSLGKRALGIKVARLSGEEAGFNDFLMRWAFRLIDIYFSFGSLAVILISSSSKGQRMGDLLANTGVIKSKAGNGLKLSSILKMNSLENYQVKYPEVRKFTEEDMLLVKKTIERVKQYPNEAHQIALKNLAEIFFEKLSVDKKPKNNLEFLKKVLQDYIVLTR